jgi:hypothetical protein
MVEAVVPVAEFLRPDWNRGSGSDNSNSIFKVCFVIL